MDNILFFNIYLDTFDNNKTKFMRPKHHQVLQEGSEMQFVALNSGKLIFLGIMPIGKIKMLVNTLRMSTWSSLLP